MPAQVGHLLLGMLNRFSTTSFFYPEPFAHLFAFYFAVGIGLPRACTSQSYLYTCCLFFFLFFLFFLFMGQIPTLPPISRPGLHLLDMASCRPH
jgi:hypothetical protein